MSKMAVFKSGLTYQKLKDAADAGALATIGTGSYRKNGKRFQAKVSYLDKRGGSSRRVYLTHTLEGTLTSGRNASGVRLLESLTNEWVQNVISDIKQVAGLNADPTMTVREALDWFIDSKDIRDENGNMIGARHSTLTFYRSCAKRIEICPALATKPVMEVTESDVDEWVEMLSRDKAKKTVSDSLNILDATCRKILGMDANPCKDVTVPKNVRKGKRGMRGKTKANSLTKNGIRRLNTKLDEREAEYDGLDLMAVGVRIALHTGMRAEEVSGLKWKSVDFLNEELYVENVIERAQIQALDDDGNKIFDDHGNPVTKYQEFDSYPKTEDSERSIHIDAELIECLKTHKKKVVALLEKEFPKKRERPNIEDLYVIGYLDGTHYSPHRLGVNFKKFCISRGIQGTEGVAIGFHHLRDTFATLSIQGGKPISEVSAILGHAAIQTTLNRYVGKDKEEQRRVVDAMADTLGARLPQDIPTVGGVTAA